MLAVRDGFLSQGQFERSLVLLLDSRVGTTTDTTCVVEGTSHEPHPDLIF